MVGLRIDRNKLYYDLFSTKRKSLSLSIILNDHHYLPCINNFITTKTTTKVRSSSARHFGTKSGDVITTKEPNQTKYIKNDEVNLNIPYTPIVIVGGGPCGLFLSKLLSQYYIPHVLYEGQTEHQRFQHPQAHFLNTRTMELLKHYDTTISNRSSSSLSSSSLYDKIRKVMPPVQYWQKFRFGYNMIDNNPLAEVLHRVDIPIQANSDANGTLIEQRDSESQEQRFIPRKDLSPCSVGHLAQHTFCRILYDEAKQQQQKNLLDGTTDRTNNFVTDLLYDAQVTDIQYNSTTDLLHVRTNDGTDITTSLVVAADGANSFIRQSICNINSTGQYGIQHLMNVHVKLTPGQVADLHANNNYAMLYSVFNEHVVAMVVCHTPGEYIIQIPFFPPYQTIENDFNNQRLQVLVDAIFGIKINIEEQVKSCRPWIMSSLIADEYYKMYNNSCGIVLVGDAAHVFPPAGGFGMNTGIQDVHNLAWKVSKWYYNTIVPNTNESETKSTESSSVTTTLESILESYGTERRSIAQDNAALSVRNYNRLLDVTKSIYLNEQHPKLLQSLLETMSFVPLPTKQGIFRTLLQTALSPLRNLQFVVGKQQQQSQTNPLAQQYVQHIRSNIRRTLKSGGGLPLLFPLYEIGFVYGSHQASTNNNSKKDDTWASSPSLVKGGLVPHVEVEVIHGADSYPFLKYLPTTSFSDNDSLSVNSKVVISTRDLSSQMVTPETGGYTKPVYTVLFVGTQKEYTDIIHATCNKLESKLGLPVKVAYLVPPNFDSTINIPGNQKNVYLRETVTQNQSFTFFQATTNDSDTSDKDSYDYVILIRPDGHIDSIEDNVEKLIK